MVHENVSVHKQLYYSTDIFIQLLSSCFLTTMMAELTSCKKTKQTTKKPVSYKA